MSIEVAVVGSYVQDLAFKVGLFPAPGETRIGKFASGPGGKGSNQAVACHRQGIETVFIGAVGNDLFGDGYKKWAVEEELPIELLTINGATSGAASIVVNERAENQIVVALGANDDLTPVHTTGALSRFQSLKVLLLQAESNLDAAAAALSYAKEHQIYSILNPAPINPDITSGLLAKTDCITPNETEFCFLVKHLCGRTCSPDLAGLSDAALREVCDYLPAAAILITLGAEGSVYYQRQSAHPALKNIKTGEIVRIPALKVNPIDTTGAGDAFNGGFAAGIVKFSGDIKRAISFATVVAGLSTEREGTAPAMPRSAEVDKRFNYQE